MGGIVTAYPLPKGGVPNPAKPNRQFNGAMRWNVLTQLIAENGWTQGVEVGLADGRTMQRLLGNFTALHMMGVDTWEARPGQIETWADWPHHEYEATARERLAAYGKRARIIKAPSLTAAAMLDDASVDFVFIDADHSTMAVLEDIKAWMPKVRTVQGVIGHDINWPSVRRAVEMMFGSEYWIGPNDTWGAW